MDRIGDVIQTSPKVREAEAGAEKARRRATTTVTAPLHPMVGNLWIPAWTVRPCAYAATKKLAKEMPLYLVIYSRTDDEFIPCYASRESLGATIGISRSTVTKYLTALGKAGLVLEIDRGVDSRLQQHRPPARWALDPFAADVWRDKVEARLARIAEEDGHDARWLGYAIQKLNFFAMRSHKLMTAIAEDMPFVPRTRRRKKSSGKSKKRSKSENRRSAPSTASNAKQDNGLGGAATQIYPTTHFYPRGEIYTTHIEQGAGAGEDGAGGADDGGAHDEADAVPLSKRGKNGAPPQASCIPSTHPNRLSDMGLDGSAAKNESRDRDAA